MRVLFDTNVVLDVLLDREPFANVATELFEKVEHGMLTGYICATTVTTIHYVASKTIGGDNAHAEIEKLISLFEVAPVNRAVIKMALKSKITDFEDAILHEAARHIAANGIVTRNVSDFRQADMTIYDPTELAEILRPNN